MDLINHNSKYYIPNIIISFGKSQNLRILERGELL